MQYVVSSWGADCYLGAVAVLIAIIFSGSKFVWWFSLFSLPQMAYQVYNSVVILDLAYETMDHYYHYATWSFYFMISAQMVLGIITLHFLIMTRHIFVTTFTCSSQEGESMYQETTSENSVLR